MRSAHAEVGRECLMQITSRAYTFGWQDARAQGSKRVAEARLHELIFDSSTSSA